jgi:FkbH-like protein
VQSQGDRRANGAERPTLRVAITATFTAEPVEASLRFWLDQLGFNGEIEFAPYNQVFQQLLDPTSVVGRNTGGLVVVLVRFEDWARFQQSGAGSTAIQRGVRELAAALRAFAQRVSTPLVVCHCPPSPAIAADKNRAAQFAELEAELKESLKDLGSIHWLTRGDLELYPVAHAYDAKLDQIGHIPYTPVFFTALGTALARWIHAIKSPPSKVVALDCDNTLWQGVVGEDGPMGVTFPPGKRALQELIVRQQEAGMVICLASKNVEEDVLEVFANRPEMPLRREHLVAWRVNWEPKSRNLASLAAELNLGLDSFIFVDDNPVECAEVRAALPEVLTLQLPADDEIPDFLRHVWAFDRLKVTDEDRKRTQMYQQNVERNRFEQEAGGIADFLAGLEIKIDIDSPADDELPRVAQLTQRTNQFNFTTVRRTEAEIGQLAQNGLECLRVRVSDRFGDYGLVGVTIFRASGDVVDLDTMLLSCRVLGRGVEHAMLARLGQIALERGKPRVDAHFAPTAKNEPAANFLESVGASVREAEGAGAVYRFPATAAAETRYVPGGDAQEQLELARQNTAKPAKAQSTAHRDKSAIGMRIATELRALDTVHKAVEASGIAARPALDTPFVAPQTQIERELTELWKQLLRLDQVGIRDDFAELGGTSLAAARLFVAIDDQFGKKLPMTTILDAPTIEQLVARIAGKSTTQNRQTLKLLKPGEHPALFLIHDGDGETLLYRNLAQRMPEEFAVYGIEPHGTDRFPILHTRIPEMAAHYVQQIQRVQGEGPYFLGGMCAGGTIAFEMALQLQAQGQAVGFVALLDSADPQAPPRVNLTSERRWARFSQALKTADSSSKLGRLRGRAVKVVKKVKNLLVYESAARAKKLSEAVRFRLLRRFLDRGRSAPGFAQGLSVRAVYNLAEREYVPGHLHGAPAILFRATEGEGPDEPFINRYSDPLLGWGRRVQGNLTVFEMPGGHSSMLQEPHVAVMAEYMKACLDRALSAEVVS